jgi:hypothetical protein
MFFFRQAKVKDLDCYAFELLSRPESLLKRDLLLNIVYGKDDDNYFQYQFEIHWPLKENVPAKYEYLEQHVMNNLASYIKNNLHFQTVSKQALKLTLARYFPDEAQWIIIDPRVSNSSQPTNKKNKTSNNPSKSNLRLEPYKLTDLVVIGVLEGENLSVEDFVTRYDQKRRKDIEHEKQQKKVNRERNRTDKGTNGSHTRRKSPQNTMRIDVDDFES